MRGRHVHSVIERRWADEVLHLHALWREGPPRNHSSNPKPKKPEFSLRPAPSAAFKKESSSSSAKKKTRRTEKNKKKRDVAADEAPASDPPAAETEWPVTVSPNSKPLASTPQPPATAEEQTLAAESAQRNGLKAAKDIFSKNGSDDEDDGMEDVDDDDREKARIFEFFVELFKGDTDLREHYEKNRDKGDFFCLVCSGIGAKVGKKYGNAIALLQHASSVSKTEIKEAHRALARAICHVIGLDNNGLPNFILGTGETLGQSLSKSEKTQKPSVENNEDIQKENVAGKGMESVGTADSSEITVMEIMPPSAMENKQKGSDTPAIETNETLVDSLPIEENEDATENKYIHSPESKDKDEVSKGNLEMVEANSTMQ